jgi:hypothetical protein
MFGLKSPFVWLDGPMLRLEAILDEIAFSGGTKRQYAKLENTQKPIVMVYTAMGCLAGTKCPYSIVIPRIPR